MVPAGWIAGDFGIDVDRYMSLKEIMFTNRTRVVSLDLGFEIVHLVQHGVRSRYCFWWQMADKVTLIEEMGGLEDVMDIMRDGVRELELTFVK